MLNLSSREILTTRETRQSGSRSSTGSEVQAGREKFLGQNWRKTLKPKYLNVEKNQTKVFSAQTSGPRTFRLSDQEQKKSGETTVVSGSDKGFGYLLGLLH